MVVQLVKRFLFQSLDDFNNTLLEEITVQDYMFDYRAILQSENSTIGECYVEFIKMCAFFEIGSDEYEILGMDFVCEWIEKHRRMYPKTIEIKIY